MSIKRSRRASSTYTALLLIPGSVGLLVSGLIGRLPLGMTALAILELVKRHGGSYAAAGLAVAACMIGMAAAAPLQGRLLDRLPPSRVVIYFAAAQAAALVMLDLVARTRAPGAAVVVLAGVSGALVPPISTCVRVAWANLTSDRIIVETAMTLEMIVQEVLSAIGPLVVAFVLTVSSADAAVIVCAVLTLLGGAVYADFARRHYSRGARGTGGRVKGPIASLGLALLLCAHALSGIAVGASMIGLFALGTRVGSAATGGVLISVWSLGSLIGGLHYGAHAKRRSVAARYRRMLGAVALLTLPLIGADAVLPSVVLSFVAGLPYPAVLACEATMIGEVAAKNRLAEAYAWSGSAFVSGVAGGLAFGGGVIEQFGMRGAFILACTVALLAASIAQAMSSRRRIHA